jgi:hypothetical protein
MGRCGVPQDASVARICVARVALWGLSKAR